MPTCLDAAGVATPPGLHGASILPLLAGNSSNWRNELLYEYYWERNFPQTPTVHALRTDRYKYIRYHGIWDTDELYDLEKDPIESRNLIFEPEHKERIRQMNTRLFELLERTDGLSMPLWPDRGSQQNLRHGGRSKAAEFPSEMERK
jgi:N-acetylglucosamine-6-sulfatase